MVSVSLLSTGDDVLAAMYAVAPDDPARPGLRDRSIAAWLPLSRRLALHYRGRGEPEDDILQAAVEGLIKAVDHYDPRFGTGFVCFAVPTITGEIKRHFRDRGWMIRVPRRLQERRMAIGVANTELTHSLNRLPMVADLAAHLELTEDQVRQGIEASHAYSAGSMHSDRSDRDLFDMIATEERAYALVEARLTIGAALAQLNERDRTIVILRFYGNLTQNEIARRLGISQMHTSRLIAGALLKMRRHIEDGTP